MKQGVVKTYFEAEFMNPKFRPSMEDVHTAIYDFSKNGTDSYFAIYDGHGGREIAEFSAANVPTFFQQKLNDRTFDIPKCMRYSYLMTDIESKTKCDGHSGCTAVTCYIKKTKTNKTVYTANVGDARAILSQNGIAIRLSYV